MNTQTVILCLLCLFFMKVANTQPLVDDKQSYQVLIFEHIDKNRTKFIREGAFIRYKLYSNPKVTYKGTLQKIADNLIIVDGREVALSDCSMISGRIKTDKEILGGMLVGMGATTAPFGTMILNFSSNSFAAGIAVIAGGVVLLGVGIYLVTSKKVFWMTKGWSVYGGEMSFRRSYN